ncbi:hypothetical protein D9M68_964660 [compost metagenome]
MKPGNTWSLPSKKRLKSLEMTHSTLAKLPNSIVACSRPTPRVTDRSHSFSVSSCMR